MITAIIELLLIRIELLSNTAGIDPDYNNRQSEYIAELIRYLQDALEQLKGIGDEN
jgi:hypothetical protein